jgi:hypothetical protein
MVPSRHHEPNVPTFTGEKADMPVSEFLDRFSAIAAAGE